MPTTNNTYWNNPVGYQNQYLQQANPYIQNMYGQQNQFLNQYGFNINSAGELGHNFNNAQDDVGNTKYTYMKSAPASSSTSAGDAGGTDSTSSDGGLGGMGGGFNFSGMLSLAKQATPDFYTLQHANEDPAVVKAVYGDSTEDPVARMLRGHGKDMQVAQDAARAKAAGLSLEDSTLNMQIAPDYRFGWSNVADNLHAAGQGALIGAQFGGGWGAAIGASIGGTANWISQAGGKSRNEQIQNAQQRAYQNEVNAKYDEQNSNTMRNIRYGLQNPSLDYSGNQVAYGGPLRFDDGGYLQFDNGVTYFNTGGSHQENPLGGIPQGIAEDGQPNLVEEGEVKYKDYIYSKRLKPSKSLLKKYSIPEKYAGKSFAEIAMKLQKPSEDRPNDPIALTTLQEMMARLRDCQEEHNERKEERKLARAFDRLSPEDQMGLIQLGMQQQAAQEQQAMQQDPMIEQQMAQQQMMQQPQMGMEAIAAAHGGKIHIDPSKKGTFTAAATKHGMGVQEFASKVLANKENYSPAMVKKANFARNSSHWHSDGGHIFQNGSWKNQDELSAYYKKVMTDWFKNNRTGYTEAKLPTYALRNRNEFNRLIQHLESNKNNTDNIALANLLKNQVTSEGNLAETADYINWAKSNYANNPLMWDSKIGIEHIPAYNLSNNTEPAVQQPAQATTPQQTITNRYWLIGPDGQRVQVEGIDKNTKIPGYHYDSKLDEDETHDGETFNDYYFEQDEPVTKSTRTPQEPMGEIKDNWARKVPLGMGIAGLAGALWPADMSYYNALNNIAAQYHTITPQYIGGYRRYNPYDVNLANNQAMAQEASLQRTNRESINRASQTANAIALQNSYEQSNAARNLAWQQANEERRLGVDNYNLGINKINADTRQRYDILNNQIRDKQLAVRMAAAKAADDATTLRSQNISNALTNLSNAFGNYGKEQLAMQLVNQGTKDGLFKNPWTYQVLRSLFSSKN